MMHAMMVVIKSTTRSITMPPRDRVPMHPCRHAPPSSCTSKLAALPHPYLHVLASIDAAGEAFGPQLNPAIAVAAAVAAIPPLVFWGRVFLNARKRVMEDEQREQERLALKRKITGQDQ